MGSFRLSPVGIALRPGALLYGDAPRPCPDRARHWQHGLKIMAGTTLTDRLFDDADTAPIDPCSLFEEWFALAQASEPNDPHAMALASVDENGMPDVRMVLLNARDARGYCFFTNFESDKGRELLANPKAAFVM